MRASFVTGCLMAACVIAATLPLSGAASAADLDGEDYAEPPYDDAYADEGYQPPARYSERYGAPSEQYEERYEEPYGDDREPLPGSIKDGYPVPMPPPRASAPPPPRYAERPPVRAERYACLEPWQIKHRLRREGWAGIQPMGGEGGIVHLRARRYESGRPFKLRVDRCSGEVIAARPRDRHRSMAYRDWRWVK
ncbi:hypothetical protein [Hyphomicrobium sp.]|uniref:hypothetical protein n=1 Tax=Hyphomicrobium sp. TaxID=82 RepID=UPI0025C2809C|nr:hypothetical protein [Hyphomicrobium sp.]MCC7251996.1 hypothetical protein [Hyphomicrobium sp.]